MGNSRMGGGPWDFEFQDGFGEIIGYLADDAVKIKCHSRDPGIKSTSLILPFKVIEQLRQLIHDAKEDEINA